MFTCPSPVIAFEFPECLRGLPLGLVEKPDIHKVIAELIRNFRVDENKGC